MQLRADPTPGRQVKRLQSRTVLRVTPRPLRRSRRTACAVAGALPAATRRPHCRGAAPNVLSYSFLISSNTRASSSWPCLPPPRCFCSCVVGGSRGGAGVAALYVRLRTSVISLVITQPMPKTPATGEWALTPA